MRVIVISIVAALLSFSTPAWAALIEYSFTGGAPNISNQYDYNYITGADTTETGFSISANYTIDTSAMMLAGTQERIGSDFTFYNEVNGAPAGPAFVSASVTKMGGSPWGFFTPAAERSLSVSYTYDVEGDYSLFNVYQGYQSLGGGPQLEYHANGTLARSFYEQGHTQVLMVLGLFPLTVDEIDGAPFVSAFGEMTTTNGGFGYIDISRYLVEHIYDESGSLLSSRQVQTTINADLSSATVAPLSVPEPGAMALFALALLSVARRKSRGGSASYFKDGATLGGNYGGTTAQSAVETGIGYLKASSKVTAAAGRDGAQSLISMAFRDRAMVG